MNQLLKKWMPYLLAAPLVALLGCLCVGLVTSVLQSFGYIPGYDMYDFTLDYYISVFSSELLVEQIVRSLAVALVASLITAVLGILLGWYLCTAFGAKGVFNAISKLPMLIPYSVCALLIIYLFSASGFLPRLLEAAGMEGATALFEKILYWPNSVGVVLVFVFHATSFFTYMIAGTMSQISSSLGNAALNLGSSRPAAFFQVVLPHCMSQVRNTYIFIFVIFFGSYEVPLLVGSTMKKLLPVQAYLDYVNFNFTVYRPEAMVLNTIMLVTAGLVVLAIYLWDHYDRKKRGVL